MYNYIQEHPSADLSSIEVRTGLVDESQALKFYSNVSGQISRASGGKCTHIGFGALGIESMGLTARVSEMAQLISQMSCYARASRD
jgi:hypothetical protein